MPAVSLAAPRPSSLSGRMDDLEPRLARLSPNGRRPVVVYVHDCPGPGAEDGVWGEALARQGYVVIAPDSRARGGRAPDCAAGEPDALLTRESEIRYALRQVRTAPWVRQSSVFLLGVGQGASVVARGRVGAVTGTVIVGGGDDAPRTSPALRREREGPPGEDDLRAVVDFLQRLTTR